jgi:pimeloyl-ACP methyl ester carboxylesterase
MATASVNGHDLHYLRRGEGPPLLLIMGMSGTHLTWGNTFLHALEQDFDLITYDHRNIGMSSKSDEPFTIADLAADASALLSELGLESANVLGISMGGMVAQELVLAHPEQVRRLVLGCTYAGGPGGELARPEVVQRLAGAMNAGNPEEAVRAGWEVNVSAPYAADAQAYEAFRDVVFQLPVPIPAIMTQMQAIGGHDTHDRLQEIQAPTLVIHGTEDQMLPVSNGRAIAAEIPGARLEILEGVGHAFFLERAEQSAQLVKDFVLAGERDAEPAPAAA